MIPNFKMDFILQRDASGGSAKPARRPWRGETHRLLLTQGPPEGGQVLNSREGVSSGQAGHASIPPIHHETAFPHSDGSSLTGVAE